MPWCSQSPSAYLGQNALKTLIAELCWNKRHKETAWNKISQVKQTPHPKFQLGYQAVFPNCHRDPIRQSASKILWLRKSSRTRGPSRFTSRATRVASCWSKASMYCSGWPAGGWHAAGRAGLPNTGMEKKPWFEAFDHQCITILFLASTDCNRQALASTYRKGRKLQTRKARKRVM